ncbi:hypothetical protein CCDG5_0331 [[Clostridium] cellulosi]|jgi:hypothetical protein|uniref:Uncharacterized protein n=1 Tax=[Clostridium] cellulosi TaxID=29343 RepID=A0A078KM04_9FIRM|nr:hypothetical protein CCDG5_0331 [[Clostridium] cellulosi]
MNDFPDFKSNEIPFAKMPTVAERSIEDELKEKLKPATFGGYSKSSVVQYAKELKDFLEQMRTNLEQQIRELVSEKGNLSQECALLRSQLSDAEKRLANLQRESQEKEQHYTKIIDEMNLKIKNMESDNEALRAENAQIREAEAELQKLRQMLQQKEDEIESLSAQLENSKKINDELKNKIRELENVQQKQDEYNRELEQLKKENMALLNQLKEAEHKNQLLKESTTNEKNAVSEKLGAVLQRNRQLEESLKKIKSEQSNYLIQSEKSYINKLEMVYKALKKEEDDKAALLKRLEEQDKVNARLIDKVKTLTVLVQNSENNPLVNELKSKCSRNEQENRQLKLQIEQLCEKVNVMENEIRNNLSQLEQQKAMFQSLISRFMETQDKLRSVIKEKNDLEVRNLNLVRDVTRLEAKLSAAGNANGFDNHDNMAFTVLKAQANNGDTTTRDSIDIQTDSAEIPSSSLSSQDSDENMAKNLSDPIDIKEARTLNLSQWLEQELKKQGNR